MAHSLTSKRPRALIGVAGPSSRSRILNCGPSPTPALALVQWANGRPHNLPLPFTFRLIARRYTELILGALPSANFSLSASYELETDRPRASFSDGVSIQFSTFRYPLFFDRAIRTGTKACLRVGVPFRPTRHYSRGT